MELANYFKIKSTNDIVDQAQNAINNWKIYADQCDVRTVSKNRIEKVIGESHDQWET